MREGVEHGCDGELAHGVRGDAEEADGACEAKQSDRAVGARGNGRLEVTGRAERDVDVGEASRSRRVQAWRGVSGSRRRAEVRSEATRKAASARNPKHEAGDLNPVLSLE